MTLANGELQFFNTIKDECDIIFDVGCREDIDYILAHPEAEYHLFEPNPQFIFNITQKIPLNDTNIRINPFGLGKETKTIKYYPDSQSFIKRTVDFQSNIDLAIELPMKNFAEYIAENNIDKIDFLKIDTEGNEPDILFYNIAFIKNHVKFVQFEYASTWLDRTDDFRIHDVFNTYNDKFKFYVLYDNSHPFSQIHSNVLTHFETDQLNNIEQYMKNSYGFNIIMIQKENKNNE